MSDDVFRYLIIGAVWLVSGAVFVWACGGAAKLGGHQDELGRKKRRG